MNLQPCSHPVKHVVDCHQAVPWLAAPIKPQRSTLTERHAMFGPELVLMQIDVLHNVDILVVLIRWNGGWDGNDLHAARTFWF